MTVEKNVHVHGDHLKVYVTSEEIEYSGTKKALPKSQASSLPTLHHASSCYKEFKYRYTVMKALHFFGRS